MNLAVLQNPDANTVARCRELGESTAPLEDGEVLMTLEEYQAWVTAEEQVTKANGITVAAKAEFEAKAAAEFQAKVDALVATGISAETATALLREQAG